jgi:hypothetical protein
MHEPVRFADDGQAIQIPISRVSGHPGAAVEGWFVQCRVHAVLAAAGEEGGYDFNGVTLLIKGSCVFAYETLADALPDYRSYRKRLANDGLSLIPFVPETTWLQLSRHLRNMDYTVEDRRD